MLLYCTNNCWSHCILDLIFTSIGIAGLFYCTWNKFACKALNMVKGHHVSAPPPYWITNEFSFFHVCFIEIHPYKMSFQAVQFWPRLPTWWLLHEIIFITQHFGILLENYIFLVSLVTPSNLVGLRILYSANIELTGWVPSSSPILNQLISLNNYKNTIFMYLGKVLRTYQNWSRVFVCEDTAVSKELIHKRASCKQNCCLVRCRLVQ